MPTNKNWKRNLIFQLKFRKSSITPKIEIDRANIDIVTIFGSASPSNLTDRKKLIAIATPPRGTIFKFDSLCCLFSLILKFLFTLITKLHRTIDSKNARIDAKYIDS